MRSEVDIYEEIRKQNSLTDYCEKHGIDLNRIGKSYRANSPFTQAHNAFNINVDNEDFWYDHSTNQKGDIVDLCSLLCHDGNKSEALLELAPEGYKPQIDKYQKDREYVQQLITGAENLLADDSQPFHGVFMQYLSARGISAEQIKRCRLGYFNGRLLIPRLNYDGIEVVYYTTRRMPHADGHEAESDERYMKASTDGRPFLKKGTKSPLGLQTLSREGLLALCEGDFDMLNFEQEGFAVLGSGGGVFSKETWELILTECENRSMVILAFDNDTAGKGYTETAARSLLSKGIQFKVINLPEDCKDINDYYRNKKSLQELIDNAIPGLEYIAQSFLPAEPFDTLSRGKKDTLKKKLKEFLITAIKAGADKPDIETLCETLKSVFPENWLKEVVRKAHEGQTEYEIVEAIRELHSLMFNEKTGFYEYDDRAGIWKRQTDTTIGAHIRTYLAKMATARKINSSLDQLKKAVDSEIPIDKLDQLPLFPFRNGTLYFDFSKPKSEFRKISPNDFVTSRRSYDFSGNAECPEWERALQVIYAGDQKSIDCLQEYFGYCLLDHCQFQKALFLRGEGSNGKSTITNIAAALFGNENVSNLEISDFADHFSIITLRGVKLNISTENDSPVREAFANLKKAINGEELRGCYKGKDFIKFKPRAKYIFAMNEDFQPTGKNFAMTRRMLLIEHNVKFVDDPTPGTNEVKVDRTIEAKLMKELPGIFLWAFKGLARLLKQKGQFTITDATASLLGQKQKPDISTVNSFIDKVIPILAGASISRADVYKRYCEHCEHEGIPEKIMFSNQKFHTEFSVCLKKKGIDFREFQKHGEQRYYEFSELPNPEQPEQIEPEAELPEVIIEQIEQPESDLAINEQTSTPESESESPVVISEAEDSELSLKKPEALGQDINYTPELKNLLDMNFMHMSKDDIEAILKNISMDTRLDLFRGLYDLNRKREQERIASIFSAME